MKDIALAKQIQQNGCFVITYLTDGNKELGFVRGEKKRHLSCLSCLSYIRDGLFLLFDRQCQTIGS